MESFATPYPVLFYDGDQEQDKGAIGIHSVLNFKKFQAQLSRLIGVPANQLSTVLVYRKGNKETDKKQKLPINETTNFNIILNQHNPTKERSCHFLVSIKRSKKERKGTRKRNTDVGEDDDTTSSRGDVSPQDQRPNQEAYTESTSPTSILQRPMSPVGSPPDVVEDNSEATRKVLVGTTEKVERLLLRRENSRVVTSASQRVEGFDTSPPSQTSPQPENRWNRGARDIKASIQNGEVQGRAGVPHVNPGIRHGEVQVPVGVAKPAVRHGEVQAPGGVANPAIRHGEVQAPGGFANFSPAIRPPRIPAATSATVQAGSVLPTVSAGVQQRSAEQEARGGYECQFCKENPFEFHHCVNDKILVGFRRAPPAGPIERPKRAT